MTPLLPRDFCRVPHPRIQPSGYSPEILGSVVCRALPDLDELLTSSSALVAEFPGPKKVNLCIIIGLYIHQKVKGYLPSY